MEVIKDGEAKELTVDNHKYINPKNLTEADLPVIVLCDDLRGFVGWAIKAHTSGNYNHAFIMHKPGELVSQNFTGFAQNRIEVYMKPGIMLKFWRIKELNEIEKYLIQDAISNRLALPAWRRSYDFIGTFLGQFLHLRWLQSPFQTFCSEEVYDDYIAPVLRTKEMSIYKRSPSELNTIFTAYPQYMECIGYWWMD